MAEIAGRNFPSIKQFPGAKLLQCKAILGGNHAVPFQFPVRAKRGWNSRTQTLLRINGAKQIRSELGKRTTYASRISTDIPLYEIDGASFDQYLEDKPRVFEAIFPDKRRSHKLNEEEWRISMLPIQFFFATVWPVVDMRLVCRTKGNDYPPGVPRDISKVLELDIIRWELQGLDDVFKPGHFSLGVKGALYPDRRGPRSRLKGQLEMKITVILPQVFSLLPEDVVRNVSESVLTRLVENMKEKVNGSLLLDYSKFRRERQKNLVPQSLTMGSGAQHGGSASGVASSSNTVKKLKAAIGMTPRPAAVYKPFADLSQNEDVAIQAMVCRSWEAKNPSGKYLGTEYVFGDSQGSALHCIARSSIAHCVVPKLEVGRIYSISKFSLAPNKLSYRIRRDDEFIIQLEGNTIITPLDCPPSGFVRHPFQLQPLDEIAFNGNKFLIDVVGRVVNLSALKRTPKGSQYIDFHLIDERSKTVKVTLWGSLCTEMLTRFGDPNKCSIVVLPAMSIRDYKGELHLSSTSGTCIVDSCDIPAVASLTTLMRETPLPLPPNMGTLLQLLQLGRQQKEDYTAASVTLICKVKIAGIRPRNSWNYYSCGLNGCKKGLTPHTDHFWCESCEQKINYPLIRYRLHLDIVDTSTSVVATVFDDIAEVLVEKQAQAVMDSWACESGVDDIPSDILRLVGTEHVFEFKTHTYYNHGSYESFTVSRVLRFIQPSTVCNFRSDKVDPPSSSGVTISFGGGNVCSESAAEGDVITTDNPSSNGLNDDSEEPGASITGKRKLEALQTDV